jgi:hypothetical protein
MIILVIYWIEIHERPKTTSHPEPQHDYNFCLSRWSNLPRLHPWSQNTQKSVYNISKNFHKNRSGKLPVKSKNCKKIFVGSLSVLRCVDRNKKQHTSFPKERECVQYLGVYNRYYPGKSVCTVQCYRVHCFSSTVCLPAYDYTSIYSLPSMNWIVPREYPIPGCPPP